MLRPLFIPALRFALLAIALSWCATAAGEELVLHWGGATANWIANSGDHDHWHVSADLSGDPQPWQDGAHAVIRGAEAQVVVNQAVNAASVDLGEEAELRIDGSPLTINGATAGDGTVVFTNTNGSSLGFSHGLVLAAASPQELAWHLQLSNDQVRVSLSLIGSGTITFNGSAQAWGGDFRIYMGSNSHLLIGPLAEINNNRSDLVNARPFWVYAVDNTAVYEHHPHFNVDLADDAVREDTYAYAYTDDDPGDGSYVKPVGGLSTWRNTSGTTITHTTVNLASIHKYTGDVPRRYTHHGLWNFEGDPAGPDPVWIIRGQPQSYDGGIYFVRDWTIVTEKNFIFDGVYHDSVNIGFSTRDAEGVTVRKEGAADLIIRGTQSYGLGSRMEIKEGRAVFYTDPLVHDAAREGNAWFAKGGDYLQLSVASGAAAAFLPPPETTFHLYAATISGQLQLELNEPAHGPLLHIADQLQLNGALHIHHPGTPGGDGYLLIASTGGSLHIADGDHQLPAGWQLSQEGQELWLRPDEDIQRRRISLRHVPEHHWVLLPEERLADDSDEQYEYFRDLNSAETQVLQAIANLPENNT